MFFVSQSNKMTFVSSFFDSIWVSITHHLMWWKIGENFWTDKKSKIAAMCVLLLSTQVDWIQAEFTIITARYCNHFFPNLKTNYSKVINDNVFCDNQTGSINWPYTHCFTKNHRQLIREFDVNCEGTQQIKSLFSHRPKRADHFFVVDLQTEPITTFIFWQLLEHISR